MDTDDSLVTVTLTRKAVRYINDRLAHDREVRARDRENKRKSRPHIDKPKTGPKNGPFIKDEVIAIEIPPPIPQTPIILPQPITPTPAQPVITLIFSPPIVPIPADDPIPANIPECEVPVPNPDIPNPPFSPIIMPIPASSPIPVNEIITNEALQPSTSDIPNPPIYVSFKQSPPRQPSPPPLPLPKQPRRVPISKAKPATAKQFPVQIPAIRDTSILGLFGGFFK